MVKKNVKDFMPISIPLGSDMGCALTDASLTHAVMVEAQLRALDLRDCPNLQTINLRASIQHGDNVVAGVIPIKLKGDTADEFRNFDQVAITVVTGDQCRC
jgi:uncharacterized protein YjbI with pentapeptide repeats